MQKQDALAGVLFKLEIIPRCNFWIQNDWTKTPFKENVHFTKMSKKTSCFHSCPCYRLASFRLVFSSSSVAAISPENWFIWLIWVRKQTSSSSSAALWRMFEGLACWAKSSLEDIWRTCLSKELPHPLISELHQERTTAAAASRFLLLLLTNSVSSRKQDDHDKDEENGYKNIK